MGNVYQKLLKKRAGLLALLCLLSGFSAQAASRFSVFEGTDPRVFGRDLNSLFAFGGLLRNGKLDFSLGLPPDEANFSRLAQTRIRFNTAEDQRRADVKNFQGFVNRTARLFSNGSILSRVSDFFGNARSFFGAVGLDSEALRQATAKFLYDTKLGTVNDPFATTEAVVGRNGRALFDLLRDRVAVNALARRNLSPEINQRGQVTVTCQQILGVKFNDQDNVEESGYKDLADKRDEECKMVVADAINNVVDIDHPPLAANQFRINPDHTVTITGLNRSFTPRQLGLLFGRQDQVMDHCNNDSADSFPPITEEHLLRQAFNPTIANAVKWNVDNVARNLLASCGVNMEVPRAFLRAYGQQANYFLNNKDSKVTDRAGTNTSRQVIAHSNAGGKRRFFFTFDTNSYKQGAQAAGQGVHQAGANNLAIGGGEGFCNDEYGRRHSFIAGVAKVVGAQGEQVALTAVDVADATLAHAKGGAVEATNCVNCHDHGPGIFSSVAGQYDRVAVPGTTDIANLGASGGLFATDAQKYLEYKAFIGAYLPNQKGGTKQVAYDAYVKLTKTARSPERMDALAGYAEGTTRNLLLNRPDITSRLQLDENGNVHSGGLMAGGACAIRNELAKTGVYPNGRPPSSYVASNAARGRGLGTASGRVGINSELASTTGTRAPSFGGTSNLPRFKNHLPF